MIWKVYFWFMVVLIVAAVWVTGTHVTWKLHIVDWLNLLLMIIGLIGVFGYAYKRRISSKRFWLVFTLASLVYQLAYSFVLDQEYGASPATSTADGLTTFIPLIPMFIALFLYVYKSRLLD
jgi:FtsH-binding integral membrane protein